MATASEIRQMAARQRDKNSSPLSREERYAVASSTAFGMALLGAAAGSKMGIAAAGGAIAGTGPVGTVAAIIGFLAVLAVTKK